jgi:hypothetical protein
MPDRKICTTLALILAVAASPLLAAETGSDPHHPDSAAASMVPGSMMSEAEGGG